MKDEYADIIDKPSIPERERISILELSVEYDY